MADLRVLVVDFAVAHGVPDPPLAALRLAASEAITNAVMHAYREHDTPGFVSATVDVDARAGRVTLLVVDEGLGMHPRSDSPGLGLGVPLISMIATEVRVQRLNDGRGTQVFMAFAFESDG